MPARFMQTGSTAVLIMSLISFAASIDASAEIDDSALDPIEITATISYLPDQTCEMLRKAKAERSERLEECVPEPLVPSPPVEKPHHIVAATAKALRKEKADEYGRVSATGIGLCGVIVHKDRVERTIAFLNSLATTLEADGLQLQPDEMRMKIVVGKDMVAFTLTEKTRREKHIPTEKEQELHKRQQAKRRRAADYQNWDLYMSLPHREPWPEYDTVYTGQLAFVIDGWAQDLGRRQDAKRRVYVRKYRLRPQDHPRQREN